MPRPLVALGAFALLLGPALAGEIALQPRMLPETKAVFGRVEARDVIPARSRIGGTLTRLDVTEGDAVRAGQSIGAVIDDKLALQLRAAEARLRALGSEQTNVQAEFERARTLLERGSGTQQRVDQLRTQLDVIRNQIAAAEAEKAVIIQQGVEGEVLAPVGGRVLKVPVARGAVVLPGEQIALVGGGGFFLRLALPERHATLLKENAVIALSGEDGRKASGRLVKIFPQIENGRVIADVEMETLGTYFVGARVLAEVPVGEQPGLVVPKDAIETRGGLDFVTLATPEGPRAVSVVTGREIALEGAAYVEILTGLRAGDKVVTP